MGGGEAAAEEEERGGEIVGEIETACLRLSIAIGSGPKGLAAETAAPGACARGRPGILTVRIVPEHLHAEPFNLCRGPVRPGRPALLHLWREHCARENCCDGAENECGGVARGIPRRPVLDIESRFHRPG